MVLQELGLAASLKIQALLFFNIGVEVGQLIFIAVNLTLPMVVLRAVPALTASGAMLTPLLVYGVGITSSYWFVERTGVFL